MSYYLKTNKVKYIKIYIFGKGILYGIYLGHQIFGYKLYFWEIAENVFFPQFHFNKGKNIFGQISPQILQSLPYTCIYGNFSDFGD